MAHATGVIGNTHYAVAIEAGGHKLVADEPASRGGANAGPAPYDLLLAALTACTTITLRMYADRKQWDLVSLTVGVNFRRENNKEWIDRSLRLDGNLSEEQRLRIAEIAERTPVTLTLKNGLTINTKLEPA
jgi:putative redox protein